MKPAIHDILAEWSKALRSGRSLRWRRFKSCRCQFCFPRFNVDHVCLLRWSVILFVISVSWVYCTSNTSLSTYCILCFNMHLMNLYFTTHLLIFFLHNLNLNCLQDELHHLHFQVQVFLHTYIFTNAAYL